MTKQFIEIPRCTKCQALQIKLLVPSFEKCKECGSKLELVKFKEISKK